MTPHGDDIVVASSPSSNVHPRNHFTSIRMSLKLPTPFYRGAFMPPSSPSLMATQTSASLAGSCNPAKVLWDCLDKVKSKEDFISWTATVKIDGSEA